MARLARSLVVALAVTALGAGCAEPPPPSVPAPEASASASVDPAASLPPVGAECRAEATQGWPVRLTNAAGSSIAAVQLGEGPLGVVLAHQSDASLCQWLPYAQVLAGKGYNVLAFDFAGYGSSTVPKQKTYVEDLRTAVTYLRDRGAQKVVIMGASMGATMGVVAAAAITPPVDGVIALSPPVTFDGVNAEKAAPSLKSPALYIAGDGDGDYAVYAKAISQATPADLRDLIVLPAPQHGVQFVEADTPATRSARVAIEAFLAEHLRIVPTPTATVTR